MRGNLIPLHVLLNLPKDDYRVTSVEGRNPSGVASIWQEVLHLGTPENKRLERKKGSTLQKLENSGLFNIASR